MDALASVERSSVKRKSEKFTAAKAKPSVDLTDWGDIEIGQQTGSGSKKVGKLRKDD